MKRKYLYLSITLLTAVVIVVAFLPQQGAQIKTAKLETTVDLWVPENYIAHEGGGYTLPQIGTVSIALQENYEIGPEQTLYEILDGGGESGQYDVGSLVSQENEDTGTVYMYKLRSSPQEYYTHHGVPPIRQDNAGENFCFYVFQRTGPAGGLPLEPGGEPTPVYSPWWDWTLDLDDGETFTLTLLLPEGYEPRRDAAQLGEARESYGDNEFSIFTTATELTRRMDGGRWMIEASWTKGTFNKLIRDFYLEVQYRKGVTIMPEGDLAAIILVGAVIALLAALYLWGLRKRHAGKRQPFLRRHGYVRAVSLWE